VILHQIYAITGVRFQPDLVWIKRRNQAENHHWIDAVRGATKRLSLTELMLKLHVCSTLKVLISMDLL
jgi:hypothetical protein